MTCEFKKTSSGSTVTYKPADIKGYGFDNDKFYKSLELKDSYRKEPIFIEVLVQGVVSLYMDRSDFYVSKGDSAIYRLLVKTSMEQLEGRNVLRMSSQHIGILTYLMQDCERVKEKINRISVSERALTELVEEYNSCVSTSFVAYKDSKPWFKAIFGAFTGYRTSSLTFLSKSESAQFLSSGDFVSHNFTAGALVELFSPRLNERIAFQAGALFCNPVYSAYTEERKRNSIYRNDITFRVKELKFPIGLQYRLPEKKYTPFFNIGLSATLHLKTDALHILEVESSKEVHRYESGEFYFEQNQSGIWGGCGLEWKLSGRLKGYAEFRYEHTSGFQNNLWVANDPLKSGINNISFTIGFKY